LGWVLKNIFVFLANRRKIEPNTANTKRVARTDHRTVAMKM